MDKDRWIVVVDGMFVNKRSLARPASFIFPNLTSTGQVAGLLGIGTSKVRVPEAAFRDIYSAIPGAQSSNASHPAAPQVVSCTHTANVSVQFRHIAAVFLAFMDIERLSF